MDAGKEKRSELMVVLADAEEVGEVVVDSEEERAERMTGK